MSASPVRYRIRHTSGWTDLVFSGDPPTIDSHVEAAAITFGFLADEFEAVRGETGDPKPAREAVAMLQPMSDLVAPEEKGFTSDERKQLRTLLRS
jgi:hypothetical protein